jgi:Domain of unknown function (DUF4129)
VGAVLVLAVVAGVVLCALIVIGAAAQPLRAPLHEGLSTSAAFGNVVVIAGMIAAGAGFVILVVAVVMFRPSPTTPVPPRRRRLLMPILLAVLVGLALRSFMNRAAPPPHIPLTVAGSAAAQREPPPASHVWRDAGWILVAVLGAAALGAAVVLGRHREQWFTAPAADPEDATIPEAVAGAIDAALSALEAAGDPRQSIIAAYARMLEALEARGLGCRPAETPRLHLARCLAAADVRPEPLEQLVELFEEARFSTHPMMWEHRDEARRALAAVRSDLVIVSAG